MGLDGASIPNGQPALQGRADATGKWGRERERESAASATTPTTGRWYRHKFALKVENSRRMLTSTLSLLPASWKLGANGCSVSASNLEEFLVDVVVAEYRSCDARRNIE